MLETKVLDTLEIATRGNRSTRDTADTRYSKNITDTTDNQGFVILYSIVEENVSEGTDFPRKSCPPGQDI